jgi:hypothetical protein
MSDYQDDPAEVLRWYGAILDQRGGASRFDAWQQDEALLIARDKYDYALLAPGSMERTRLGGEIRERLKLLPPIVTARRSSGAIDTTGMSLQEIASLYARTLVDPEPGYDADGPLLDVTAGPPEPAPPPPAPAPGPVEAPPYQPEPESVPVAASGAVLPPFAAEPDPSPPEAPQSTEWRPPPEVDPRFIFRSLGGNVIGGLPP